MSDSNVSLRYSPPTKFTKEPYLYQLHVLKDNEPTVCYIQISEDEESPKWARYSTILEIAYFDKLSDPTFVESCITKYKNAIKTDEHKSP